ncbi:hypothetical protein C8Q74DRAFT_1364122 [Fomes fomentarius]|nr:hypothetical protein C8Q74DRAFT_1364122 [Fomes fomentarius]
MPPATQQQGAPESRTAFIPLPNLEPENMAGFKVQLDELKRECDYLQHHRDVALQASGTYKETMH